MARLYVAFPLLTVVYTLLVIETDELSSLSSPNWCTPRYLWSYPRLRRPRCSAICTLHRRLLWPTEWYRSWLRYYHHGRLAAIVPSRFEPKGDVSSRTLLHRLREQYQQRNMPLAHHGDCAPQTSRKADNIVQHAVVSWGNHSRMGFLRDPDKLPRKHGVALADRSPVLDAWNPASHSLLLPGVTTIPHQSGQGSTSKSNPHQVSR